MSKFLKTVGLVVGVVALAATGIGAVAGGTIIGTAVGAAGPMAITLGSVTSAIAAVGGIASGAVAAAAMLIMRTGASP